jgi:hypothetical protein
MPDDLPDIRLRGDELIGEAALKDLLVIGDSLRLEETQKRIDNHISRQSLAIEIGTWPVSRPLPDYQKEPSYPVQEGLPQWWEWDLGGYPEQTTVVRNVLPTRKAYFDDPNPGQAERWGEIRYDLVAKFSEQGTRWALATFSWDNFAGEFYRAEIVKTFDTLDQASVWLSTERERAAVENRAERALGNHLPDPVEEIVAEMQMASNGAKRKLDQRMVAELTERTHNLGMER